MKEKSKFLSYLLRHKPEKANLVLDKEGWTDVATLIKNAKFTLAELQEIVRIDEKGRYSFSPDGTKIRANQGHSTKSVRMTFDRAVPPPVLYHGTSIDNIARVMKEGLKPMNRHHVHLSSNRDTAQDVAGRRKGETTVLEINTAAMLKDGIQFYRSENNVWLVDHVDPKYFERK